MIAYIVAIGFAIQSQQIDDTVASKQLESKPVVSTQAQNSRKYKSGSLSRNRTQEADLRDSKRQPSELSNGVVQVDRFNRLPQVSNNRQNRTADQKPTNLRDTLRGFVYKDSKIVAPKRAITHQSSRQNHLGNNIDAPNRASNFQSQPNHSFPRVANTNSLNRKQPKKRTREFISKCRETAMKLDLLACGLEEIEEYDQADKLRAQAREIRLKCRNVHIVNNVEKIMNFSLSSQR